MQPRDIDRSTRAEEGKIRVNELHGIKASHEASVLRRYVEHRVDELAAQALLCTRDDLDQLQGRAAELRALLKTMERGPAKPPQNRELDKV